MLFDQPYKMYYSIGEVAQKFGTSTSMIRFWEKEFKLISPKKNTIGNRQFTKEDIEKIEQIYDLLKNKGFTIQGAKNYLKTNKAKLKQKALILKKLNAIQTKLQKLSAELSA